MPRQLAQKLCHVFELMRHPKYELSHWHYEVGTHEQNIRQMFEQKGHAISKYNDSDTPQGDYPKRTLLLGFTNRSGSNYLAECLASSGKTNLPDEWLNYERVTQCVKNNHYSRFDEVLAHIRKQSPSGEAAALKCSWDQLSFLAQCGALPHLLPNSYLVIMLRKDWISQAISFVMAERTGQWKSYWNANNEQASDDQIAQAAATVTAAEVAEKVNYLAYCEQQFRLLLTYLPLPGKLLYYEDCVTDMPAVAKDILSWMGIEDAEIMLDKVKTQKQSHPAIDEMKERIKKEIKLFT